MFAEMVLLVLIKVCVAKGWLVVFWNGDGKMYKTKRIYASIPRYKKSRTSKTFP
jgi:hypothetical protein